MAKPEQTKSQRSNRKMLTVFVLVLMAVGFYVASFFVASG